MISITEIQNITEHCMKILSCTEYLRRDEATKEANEFAKSIFGSIRKLFIASMIKNLFVFRDYKVLEKQR